MDKFILSSKVLHKAIRDYLITDISMEDFYVVSVECTDGFLSFGGYYDKSIEVESESDWKAAVKIGKLRSLFRILDNIEEQPIGMTVNLSNNDEIFCIKIFSIVI